MWLKRYAETLLFMASNGDNANDSVLQQSFAKAVDLARINEPSTSAHAAFCAGRSVAWQLLFAGTEGVGQDNAKQTDSQAVSPVSQVVRLDPVAFVAPGTETKLSRVNVILKHPIPSAVIAAVLIGLLYLCRV